MELFREVMNEGNLYDMGWKGEKFTWSNSHENDTFTKERLDKTVVNPEWLNIYKEVWVEIVVVSSSDHKPLIVHVLNQTNRSWGRQKALNMRWSKKRKLGGDKEIEAKTKLLQRLQTEENNNNTAEIRKVKEDLNVLLEMENLKWKQIAKCNWCKYEDRNSKYFYACANQRRKKNWIRAVEDERCKKVEGHKNIEATFTSYSEKLFQSTNLKSEDIKKFLECIEKNVSSEMNDTLMRSFSRVEVEETLRQMALLGVSLDQMDLVHVFIRITGGSC
ncbi:uncharacterized protein LOC122277140 [Carya illinoinensis]|uniref:uncharacterized protein LOC122277140 n=1 Tax=Carya illinoinensis TaxID=32201 RepID=UPI001C71B751|nr:uncharacterized protein LOC122277140 [Carya illinoinensis]